MTQGTLPFQYLREKTAANLTSFAGLPLYLEMAMAAGLGTAISAQLNTKKQGWTDAQTILSLVLLNLAGGDCVEDMERLAADEGLSLLLLKIEAYGMKRKERRAHEKRFRQAKKRAFPSASSTRRYLEKFHHASEEKKRVKGAAFVPAPNEPLQKLGLVQRALIDFAQQQAPSGLATLDQDATLAATHKSSAYYSYEKYKAYQPFNTYWHEQGLLLHSEFRDGNVPAGFEQLRILRESLGRLPAGVNKVCLRSDSAGYQQSLLKYCAEGKNERFGTIEFAVAANVTLAFKAAVGGLPASAWRPLDQKTSGTKLKAAQEWAEVCYVPSWAGGHCKSAPDYRFIAVREKLVVQQGLAGIAPAQCELPFQTIALGDQPYKLFGIVTNSTRAGNELVQWHRQRCGDSEKVHHVEKNELAGGQFPSQKFGANAAWWQIMVMAFNLNALMKKLALPSALQNKGMKAIRFQVIGIAGKVAKHSRGLLIKLSGTQEMVNRVCDIRQKIMALSGPPPFLSTA